MKIKLSENIRAFRKEHAMTQEQLTEVLNVTVGAVYKWESGQSVPELGTIVELADLFDTSVDVLLGYEMKDNRLQTTIKRLEACRHEKIEMVWRKRKRHCANIRMSLQLFITALYCSGFSA